jgi:glycosyltransferase involved in cell wall biosynthesis
MRIALASLNYLPSTGGLVSYLQNFAYYLESEGHEVDILCAHERGSTFSDIEVKGRIRIIRLNVLNIPKLTRILTPWVIVRKIKSELKRSCSLGNYDLIVSRHLYFAYAIGDLCQSKGIFLAPLVASRLVLINSRREPVVKKVYSWLIAIQLYLMEKSVIRSNLRVVVLSKSKSEEFSKLYGIPPLPISRPGVAINRFYPAIEHEYSGTYKLVTVCRLVEEKNLEMLIRAVGALVSDGMKLELKIIGDGPLRPFLESLTRDMQLCSKIEFTGFVDDPENYYRESDVFVLPSRYEGFGHVYIEANACGIPVIGLSTHAEGAITACDEIIQEGYNGFLIYDDSIEGVRNAIYRFLRCDLKPNEWEEQCTKHVGSKFSWASHLAELVEIDVN